MEDLKELISSVSLVSFDIFDTAILRAVQKPVDLFLIVAEQFTQNTDIIIDDFKGKRIQAEKISRDQVWEAQQHTEVTLDEIYESLTNNFDVPYQDAQQLKHLELEIERQCCLQNPFMFELYQYCRAQGKNIIFTSDIYLPEELIQSILNNAGYKHYEYLFVSSFHNKTKSTGVLFQHVLDTFDCEGDDILHIGDNYQTDVKMAQKFGINAFYYEKCLDVALKNKSFLTKQQTVLAGVPALEGSIYLATIINHSFPYRQNTAISMPAEKDFWYTQGYEKIGIFYLGFASWLMTQLQKDSMEKVYFLSRDGFIMQKVYEKLKNTGFSCSASSEYLYASRRALNVPSIQTLDDQDINFLISGTSRITVKAFLSRIGLDAMCYQQQCLQAGFESIEHIVNTGKDYEQLRQLFKLLEGTIKSVATEEIQALHAYFKQKGLLDCKKVAFVDIGWHGSLQRSLKKLLALMGAEPEIKGYYLGTFPPAQDIVRQGHPMSAYLCEQGEPDSLYQFIQQCVEIFELIHGAPHGSVIKMQNRNEELSCVFDQDIDKNGKWKKVEKIQQGALDFIDDYLKAWSLLKHKVVNKELAIAPIGRLLAHPGKQEAINYGNLEHAEGYGDVYIKRFIAKPQNLLLKLFMPHKLLRDYRQSFWRVGFLKRCLFFW